MTHRDDRLFGTLLTALRGLLFLIPFQDSFYSFINDRLRLCDSDDPMAAHTRLLDA